MNAIETTYKGYKFRSRLEAKWACMFDQLGWDWEYEPIDFNGYIPDFYVTFGMSNWYVEIKPAMHRNEFLDALRKPHASRGPLRPDIDAYTEWNEPLLVLGGKVKSGIHTCCDKGIGLHGALEDTRFGGWIDDVEMHLVLCPVCKRHVPVSGIGSWNMPCCEPPNGLGELVDGWPHKHWRWALPACEDFIDTAWAHAHNATKWARRG